MSVSAKPAIFMDRDGVVTVEKRRISLPQEIELYPYAVEAIQILKRAGYYVIVVTNQSGVARGLFEEDELQELHKRLADETGIDAFYYCPHHAEGKIIKYRKQCVCRKPGIGLLIQAKKDFDIALEKSWMIGDRAADIEFGIASGLKTILVRTGYGGEDLSENLVPDLVCEDLMCAARLIFDTHVLTWRVD